MPRDTRVQKFMAEAGIASRRKSEELIKKGKVKVNGRPVSLGDKVDPKKDIVTVDNKEIKVSAQKYYIMLHKPRGYVTTMNDDQDRKCVADLVSDIPARLFPIGRLDKDSEGLLLMTNDGTFANMVAHPSGHIPKLYRVSVKPAVNEDQVLKMSIGVEIEGVKTAPCTIRVTSEEKERSVMEIVLNEGRNRQIRKMCEVVGLEVLRLKRSSIGPLKLGMLQVGKYRELGKDETRKIAAASQKAKERNDRNDKNSTDGKPRERSRNSAKPSRKRR
ncbi:MAG: pseudouridine synthase [Clostridia bacterium]